MDNTNLQYVELVREFEQELQRGLTDEERNFLKWMANKQKLKHFI